MTWNKIVGLVGAVYGEGDLDLESR